MRKKGTVMILPVGLDCNLACRYCYHGRDWSHKSSSLKMSDGVLEKIIKDSVLFAEDLDFVWHGGEPLLAGMDHFHKAISFQKKTRFSGRTRNIVQTNATLLTEPWCELLAKQRFIVSTSIDGPASTNDSNRIFRNGKGTYGQVTKATQRWRKTGNRIGAITVITESNVGKPSETYKGIRAAGVTSCALHLCSQNDDGSTTIVPKQKRASEFLKEIFELWLKEDDPSFPIRNFRNVLRFLHGARPLDCASRTDGCWGFIAINSNGDVYPCHRFVNRKRFKIGNLKQKSLNEIYRDGERLYKKMCSLSEICTKCEWLGVCGGGCAYERLIEGGSFEAIHPECEIKKETFSFIKERVSHLINP